MQKNVLNIYSRFSTASFGFDLSSVNMNSTNSDKSGALIIKLKEEVLK